MKDSALRKSNKIGIFLGTLCSRFTDNKSDNKTILSEVTKANLFATLDLDIDTLLDLDHFIDILVEKHGFNAYALESFAELLANLAAVAPARKEQCRLAAAACAIYKYQDEHQASASAKRYYIQKELKNYYQ